MGERGKCSATPSICTRRSLSRRFSLAAEQHLAEAGVHRQHQIDLFVEESPAGGFVPGEAADAPVPGMPGVDPALALGAADDQRSRGFGEGENFIYGLAAGAADHHHYLIRLLQRLAQFFHRRRVDQREFLPQGIAARHRAVGAVADASGLTQDVRGNADVGWLPRWAAMIAATSLPSSWPRWEMRVL